MWVLFKCKLTKGHRRQSTVEPFPCPDCPAPRTARGCYGYRVPRRWETRDRARQCAQHKKMHPRGWEESLQVDHLNLMRLVQMSGGQKKDATSLEMPVSVVIAPHQIFVSRAWPLKSSQQGKQNQLNIWMKNHHKRESAAFEYFCLSVLWLNPRQPQTGSWLSDEEC